LGSTCGNYGSIWTDYDNNGDMDCFVAKCGCDPVDLLMRNDGSGQFSSVATAADFADNHQSWSSAWGDFDNDGDMDVVVGSSSSSYHKVMENDGTGNFTNVTVGSGFDNFSGQSIEWTTHDFDNDGFLDVMGGGSLMMGNGDLTFTQVAGTFSNGPMGDVNNDGFVDYMNGGTAKVNDGNSNHYLKVATHGTISNRDGIGARVEVVSALGTQIRDVKSGDGFRYMSSLNTHFGLGQDEVIDQVTVYWPSGITQTILAPPIDTLLVIEEAISTSVNDGQVIQDLSVYPNPAKDILTLKSLIELRGSLIQVVDAAGRVVLERVLQQNQIDLADLATGVYTVRAYAADRTLSLPFMKE
ncbi:MAG: ASPIC/UnbV domain-containing protein, partial [Flavobacteriales bacterium]|nr:ASPIC/UnbV domain-containing protein [Flavobacteriales bacterium]